MYIDEQDYDDERDFGDVAEKVSAAKAREHPHNCIGYLMFSFSFEERKRGTGFLIAADLVLTVAHNVYSRADHTSSVNIVFCPGVSSEITPDNTYKVINVRFPNGYRTCPGKETINYDYALLKLDRKVVRQQYIELGLNYVHCQ
jgi:V8-like Glu-specific endopeptidase